MTALIKADILKLVRRRGLMVATIAIIAGIPVVVLLIWAIGRAVEPDLFGAYGGNDGYEVFLGITNFGSFVMSILVGAMIGNMDEDRGVFRDLAATGVNRTRLALSRVPAAFIVVLPWVVFGFTLAVAVGGLAPGSGELPSVADLARDLVVVLVTTAVYSAMAVGLSALIGSVNISLTVLFAWLFIFQPLLASAGFLKNWRRVLLDPALTTLNRPGLRLEGEDTFGLGIAGAIVVIVVWVGAFVAAGAWRVATRDA